MTTTPATPALHPTDAPVAAIAADPRAVFATATSTVGQLIAGIDADELHRPTPCAGFDVSGLLGHLEIVLRRVVALAEGTDPMAMPETVPTPTDGWYANWQRWTDRVAAAWADPATLDRTMSLPWATGPGSALLATYVAELTVHTWDLAQALGREVTWDDEVIAVALAAYQRVLPEPSRDDRFAAMREQMPAGWQPPFANAVEPATDATTIDRLVAWTGRQP